MKEGDSMGYIRIHCGYCGGTWEVYRRQMDISNARICPHCDSRIDSDTWASKIMPAVEKMNKVNLDLIDHHLKNHSAGYEVDYIADGYFQDAKFADLKNQMYELQNTLETLQEALQDK